MSQGGASTAIWQNLAQQWDHVGPPFRPAPEDIEFAARALNAIPGAAEAGALTSILLGVTPELAHMLADTRSLEVDHSLAMIGWSWRRFRRGRLGSPVVAKWTKLPLRDQSADIIAGDGCNIQLDFPGEYRTWFAELARALKSNGRFVTRMFLAPEISESPEAVIDDLKHGRIANSNVLRMRLFMALQGAGAQSVAVSAVWDYWKGARIDPLYLTSKLGWSSAAVSIFEVFKSQDMRYSFPTLGQVRQILGDYFRESACHFPSYEIGERCPTLVLNRR